MPIESLLVRFALAAALACPAGAALAGDRVDVPVHETVLPDGTPRYWVPVTVGGGAPLQAMLDTGSFGLRVLKSALTSGYQATDLKRDYAYGGGAKFEGVLARAVVSVGAAQTSGPVLFHLVEKVGCAEGRPRCAASKIKAEDYRIGGEGYAGQGFPAILGLSLRRAASQDSAQNPLTANGARSWIVTLPRPGSGETGHLVVDPTEADRAGFTMLKLPEAGGVSGRLAGFADTALPGCVVEDGGQRFCGRTLLNSGAPGLSVATDTVDGPKPWGAGRHARIEIGGDGGPVSVPFTSGDDAASRVLLHPPHGPAGGAEISVGTLPFVSYAVLYDAQAGAIGFRMLAPAAP